MDEVNKTHQVNIFKLIPGMRDTLLKLIHVQLTNSKLFTSNVTTPLINDRSQVENKTQYNYLNNLMRGLSGNGKCCKILNKTCNGQNKSAENT